MVDLSERDAKGHYLPGHKGGPGRLPRAAEEGYLERLRVGVSLEDWDRIVHKAVTQAKKGDRFARQWLGEYLMGKPVERQEGTFINLDVTRLDDEQLARVAAGEDPFVVLCTSSKGRAGEASASGETSDPTA